MTASHVVQLLLKLLRYNDCDRLITIISMLITKDEQRCHSKKYIKNLDAPITNPRKPKIKFLEIWIWLKFQEKNPTFPPRNPTFPEKIGFLSAKISDDLFFSHYSILAAVL